MMAFRTLDEWVFEAASQVGDDTYEVGRRRRGYSGKGCDEVRCKLCSRCAHGGKSVLVQWKQQRTLEVVTRKKRLNRMDIVL